MATCNRTRSFALPVLVVGVLAAQESKSTQSSSVAESDIEDLFYEREFDIGKSLKKVCSRFS